MANRKDDKGRVLKTGETQRKDGTYQYSWLDGLKKRRYVYAPTLSELRQKEKEIQKNEMLGIDSVQSKVTLNQLFALMMNLKKDIRETTRDNYNSLWKNYVEKTTLGNMQVAKIKQIHIKTHYDNLLTEKQLKGSSIKVIHALVFQVLEMAVNSDWILKNPAKNATDFVKVEKADKVPLTQKQVEQLKTYCENSDSFNIYIPYLTIAIGTCLRNGEITGLTWKNVDMKNKTINIDHQLVYKNYGDGCKFHIHKPKTSAGARVIPMTDAVYKAFKEIRRINFLLGRRCTTIIDGYSDFVFVSSSGKPYNVAQIDAILTRIEQGYNRRHTKEPIPHLSSHILRHTGATLYSTKGMDIKALQNLMGHSDAGMTLNTYNHISYERTQNELKRIENLIAI